MLQVIAYALAVSAALGLAGLCMERLSAMLGWPRRYCWAIAMVLSILWPLAVMSWMPPAPVTAPVATRAEVAHAVASRQLPTTEIAIAPPPEALPRATGGEFEQAPAPSQVQAARSEWRLPHPSDRTLLWTWAVTSGVLLLGLAAAELLLHARASRWPRQTVLNHEVLVSGMTGPALLGAWRPRIVVPGWFLDESPATQSLILEHERQHVVARDPLLLRLALLIVIAVPWSLPLWWQLRRLRQAIELDCDARVLRAGAEAGSYGEVLLAVTQRASSIPVGAIAMGEPVSALERRIRHLVADRAGHSTAAALLAVLSCGAGIGVAFALDAPALPRNAAQTAVRHTAPFPPLQQAPALSMPVIEVAARPGYAAAPVAQATDDTPAQWKQLQHFCLDCHNKTDWAGGLALDTLSLDDLGHDAEHWEAVVRRLRTGSMPPAGQQRPDRQVVRSLARLLEAKLDHASLELPHMDSSDAPAPSDIELASRLASLLWRGLPDAQLQQVANRGELHQPARLAAQVRRMLADPKAIALAADFGFQWLDLSRMDAIEPDARMFRDASIAVDVRPLLKREMELFLYSVLASDQPVTALLTADYTYLNDELAVLYGVDPVEGSEFRRVTLHDSRRHGLLGKGAVLMATSLPDRSSPSLRGSWILNRIAGMPQYERPPNVGMLEEGSSQPASVRERLAQHVKNRSCFACHGMMDPLGYALENFDTMGRLRERDPDTDIALDTIGTTPDGVRLTGPDDLRRMLAAEPERFVQTVTERLMAYALGREVGWRDMPFVRQVVRNAAKDNYRFASIVSQIVASDAFRRREPAVQMPASKPDSTLN